MNEKQKNVAIILSGGVGSRVGAGIPKQFIKIQGKPIIAYTIEKFQNHPEIDAIEVVCVKEYIENLKHILKKYHFNKVKWIVEGGEDFQQSVIHGVYNLKKHLKDDDIVLIHYAASPFIETDIISDSIRVGQLHGNCVSATPMFLLMGSNDDNKKSTQWIDRDKIMGLNSPQTFKYGYVKQLYDEAIKNGIVDEVEPHTTSLMYKMGRTIYFSKGNQTNIKITTKEDLALFEGYVLQKKREHWRKIFKIRKTGRKK